MTKIVEPVVRLLASTAVTSVVDDLLPRDPDATDAEHLIEMAGRSCYQSFHRPNPATRRNADYIERTIFEQAHGSIAEHATATLLFTGVSRAFLAELTRHRHLSFSVLSQRFVNESETAVVMPPAIKKLDTKQRAAWLQDQQSAVWAYVSMADALRAEGEGLKQAREAARSLLPNAVETRMVVTGNLRAWLQTIERRTDPSADAEMIQVMRMANDALVPVAPSIFARDKR